MEVAGLRGQREMARPRYHPLGRQSTGPERGALEGTRPIRWPGARPGLRTLPISESDMALDIGCGKGAALLTMARYPFSRVDGVDISKELLEIARENLRRMRVRGSVLFHSDAAAFDGYDRYTFYYLYNPFPQAVMAQTMVRISESLKRRPRKVTLVYTNPKERAVIESAGFRRIAEFEGKVGEFLPVIVYSAGPS